MPGNPKLMNDIKVGQSELDVLSFIAQNEAVTLRTAAEFFAADRGWSRTTVQKTMDRLIEKGLVAREAVDGIFQYRSVYPADELQSKLVDQFVRKNLGGSLRPFVAYLHGDVQLSETDIDELKSLVEELESRRSK